MKLAYRPVFPGTVGSAPPVPPDCDAPVCDNATMCAWGRHWGYMDGQDNATFDAVPGGDDTYSPEQIAAYAACYQEGYDQGVRERDSGTGTLVCDVINIQTALNRLGAGLDVDGDWGPKTEAALKASGKSCAELVPACKTCPRPASTPVPSPPPKTTPVSDTNTTKTSSIWPWLVGGAAVAAVGLLAFSAWPWPNPASTPTPAKRRPGGGWNRDFMLHDDVVVGGRAETAAGAKLVGKRLRIVQMGASFVETDDGSVWTFLRNGGYNYRLGPAPHGSSSLSNVSGPYDPALFISFAD